MSEANLLASGTRLRAQTSGLSCAIDYLIGRGGQGEVYRGTLGGSAIAVKWYLPEQATRRQERALLDLVRLGSPSSRFLWPLDLLRGDGRSGFGYAMPLRPHSFRGLTALVRRQVDPGFRVLATVALGLVESFLQLHARGLAYRDISFGNVFFDASTGAVLICDTDNVAVDAPGRSGVLGTPDFMAPEIVRREATPSAQTDLYSLSVLLFYIFHLHHPLYGRRMLSIPCLDLPARTFLCGTSPLFIFDPHDPSNAAVTRDLDPLGEAGENALAHWRIYPPFLRALFTRAFTEGLRDPRGRVRESEWRTALVRLRDTLVYCAECGAENFHDPLDPQGALVACWGCAASPRLPPALLIGRQAVMLNHDTHLYPHHLDDQRRYDFGTPLAEVARHPADPELWGLRNLSATAWTAIGPDGATLTIPSGRALSLAPGTRVHFGSGEGLIRG